MKYLALETLPVNAGTLRQVFFSHPDTAIVDIEQQKIIVPPAFRRAGKHRLNWNKVMGLFTTLGLSGLCWAGLALLISYLLQ